jgi:CheY-like chemotaxis protein
LSERRLKGVSKGPVKVLYIDDRAEIRRVFADLMRFGVNIETDILLASDGQEGLEIASQDRPDVVFVDSIMPVMNGIETIRRMKADKRLRDVPVIMISAYVDRVDSQQEAEQAGVAFFISKPFTAEELERAMHKVLGL